jgi:hypothetical protein
MCFTSTRSPMGLILTLAMMFGFWVLRYGSLVVFRF